MLVLTRKQQEKIHIGGNVVVTVVRIKGNAVRIGIEAPDEVRIIRGEIAATEPAHAFANEERLGLAATCMESGCDSDSEASSVVGKKWNDKPLAVMFPTHAV